MTAQTNYINDIKIWRTKLNLRNTHIQCGMYI